MKHIVYILVGLFTYTGLQAQSDNLCVNEYWTEDEANIEMKKMASKWNDLESWEIRKNEIKAQIIYGSQIKKMPKINGDFKTIINSTRKMNGYIVENIAIESYPGHFITGNLYRPNALNGKFAAFNLTKFSSGNSFLSNCLTCSNAQSSIGSNNPFCLK